MPIEGVTAGSPQNYNRNQSSLYSKQNFLQIGAINDFMIGSALGFGILESRDKFKLLKKENTALTELKTLAKKHTKRNVLLGLGIGTLYTAIDLLALNKFLPKIEKAYDKFEEMDNKK